MPRGHWVGCLYKHVEFDIRNFDQWRRAPSPKTFATLLDENPDYWCEITQLLAAKPPFRPP